MKISLTFALLLLFPASIAAETLNPQAYDLLKSFYAYDKSYPLRAEIAGTIRHEGYSFERLTFESFHGGTATGLIALPEQGQAPYPVVLLLHGLSGNKKQWLGDAFTSGGEVTRGLLRAGYAVLALDAQYHGDRSIYNRHIDVGDMVFNRGWGVRYANMLTQSVVDYRRAMDYLATREDFDPTRIGVLGYSMGGHMTFMLGAVEERVKVVVACVVPHMSGMPMAATSFAADLGRVDLLMLMGSRDRYYSTEQAESLFKAVPGNNKELRFFDSGHSLPIEYVEQAVNWISGKL